MSVGRTTRILFLLMALFGALSPEAHAQVNSGPATINLLAVRNPGVAVSATPGNVNFALVNNGVATGSTPITITTTWDVQPSVGNLTLYAFFSSTTAALSNGAGNNIASSRVKGSVNGGAFVPFTGISPYAAGSSLQIFTFRVLGSNRRGTRNDTLNLQIDLTGAVLPAGTYSGTLLIQAQAL
ncbi:MAG: hypothetical protein HY012_04555 [Acidobacteria bacterium]|nr:hypothetical protein [Acidobacteriota bacterium]